MERSTATISSRRASTASSRGGIFRDMGAQLGDAQPAPTGQGYAVRGARNRLHASHVEMRLQVDRHGSCAMPPTIAVIAPGAMGAAVGRRLGEHGARVVTVLDGRSET